VPQLLRVLNMNQMPDWVQSLFEAVGSTIEFKGLANLEARFSAADETAWEQTCLRYGLPLWIWQIMG
jgi:hypothetical protein